MQIPVRDLTTEAFSDFGQVIELPSEPADPQKVQRWPNISIPDFQDRKGVIDILYSNLRPLEVSQLEVHSNSTQTFVPLGDRKFLVVVGKDILDDKQVNIKKLKAFVTNGRQGITLKAGVWHCSPLPVEGSIAFVLIHRSPDVDLASQVAILKEVLTFEL